MTDMHGTFVHWRPYDTKPTNVQSRQPAQHLAQNAQFEDVLAQAKSGGDSGWTISQHAKDRLAQRGISLSAGDFKQMADAANQAEQKGAKNAFMVVGPNMGLVVHLPSRTVVTAMNQTNTIVTQIDSVVFVNKPDHTDGSLLIGDRQIR